MNQSQFLSRLSLIILCIIAIFQSCKEPLPEYSRDQLSGKWEIIDAQRNAKSINTLNNGFFIFHGDKGMSTNIMPNDSFLPFKLNNGVIKQEGGESLQLKIEKLTADSLILNTLIKKDRFIFYMIKDTESQ